MRERLIELIGSTKYGKENSSLVGKNFQQEFIGRIADHLLANGVIVPPCKVGQTVYYINFWLKKEHWKVYEGKISMLQQKADKSWKFRMSYHLGVGDYTLDELGKTVFLTREEAEAALKAREENAKET